MLQFLTFILLIGLKSADKDKIIQRNIETRNQKYNDEKCRTLTNNSDCSRKKSESDQRGAEFQSKHQNQSADVLQDFTDEFPEIVLNAKTEKSLNPNSVSHLTKMLHISIRKPYLIEDPYLCASVDNLKVLVIVHSATYNFEKRNAIRETWTNNSHYPNLGNVRTLFVLGRSESSDINTKIKQEFETYGDILQGDFTDSYHNITVKGVIAYKWLTERCRNAEIILKVDDDVFIDMFYFLTAHAPVILSKPDHISCRLLTRAKVMRNHNETWYVGSNQFVDERKYPPYCQGFMAAFNNDVIPKLFKSALVTPFFWIDDIYLYGLVPKNIDTISYNNLQYGKTVTWGAEVAIQCFRKRRKCHYFVVLIWNDIPNKMRELWSLNVRSYQGKLL